MIDRRRWLAMVAVGIFASSRAVLGQQREKVYRIGYLSPSGSPIPALRSVLVDAFAARGWVEGRDYVFEDRYANNEPERLPGLADELVRLKVDVILSPGTLGPLAAKRATATIPIVMIAAGDPLGSGLVSSLAHPGGNVTGLSLNSPELAGKRLQLLKEMLPAASRVAVLWNADNPYSALVFRETLSAGAVLGLNVQSLEIKGAGNLDNILTAAAREKADALIVVEDPLTYSQRQQIMEFAAKQRLPAMYGLRELADIGGLFTYGVRIADLYRQSAEYLDKIRKGAKPGDLPIEQPTKFEFVINLKTAKALGLTIPQSLLLRADEVIQ